MSWKFSGVYWKHANYREEIWSGLCFDFQADWYAVVWGLRSWKWHSIHSWTSNFHSWNFWRCDFLRGWKNIISCQVKSVTFAWFHSFIESQVARRLDFCFWQSWIDSLSFNCEWCLQLLSKKLEKSKANWRSLVLHKLCLLWNWMHWINHFKCLDLNCPVQLVRRKIFSSLRRGFENHLQHFSERKQRRFATISQSWSLLPFSRQSSLKNRVSFNR